MTPDQGVIPFESIISPREKLQIGLKALRGEGVPEGIPMTRMSPFPDGERLLFRGEDAGWDIRNNGLVITLTQDQNMKKDPFGLIPYVGYMNDTFPVFNNVYTHTPGTQEGQSAVCTFPTLFLANAMNDVIYDGMPTAGIHLVQDSDRDTSRFYVYNATLMGFRLVASSGEERFLHDLISHDQGSRSTPASDFAAYLALGKHIDQVGVDYNNIIKDNFAIRLAHAFDTYSSTVMESVMDDKGDLRRNTLPDECDEMLQTEFIGYDFLPPKLIAQSMQIIEALDTTEHPYQRTIMRKKRKGRTAYFDEVRRRLLQDPSELQLAA